MKAVFIFLILFKLTLASSVKELEDFGSNIFTPFKMDQKFVLNIKVQSFEIVQSKKKPLKDFAAVSFVFHKGLWKTEKNEIFPNDSKFIYNNIQFIKQISVGNGLNQFLEKLVKVEGAGVDNFDIFNFKGLKNNISSYQLAILNPLKLQVVEKKPTGTISTFYNYEIIDEYKFLSSIIQNRYEGIQRIRFDIKIGYEKLKSIGYRPNLISSRVSLSIADNNSLGAGREINETFKVSYKGQ
ncbi:hypothetical protein N9N67_08250 [Bacteriovoracaceae bacterium]|nr:hypothetical protein [Bacteriovoracaceae bacterium]